MAARAKIDACLQNIRIAAGQGREVFYTDLADAVRDYEKARKMDASLKCADCCKVFEPDQEHFKIEAMAINSITGARIDQIRMVLCAACFEQNEIAAKLQTPKKEKPDVVE